MAVSGVFGSDRVGSVYFRIYKVVAPFGILLPLQPLVGFYTVFGSDRVYQVHVRRRARAAGRKLKNVVDGALKFRANADAFEWSPPVEEEALEEALEEVLEVTVPDVGQGGAPYVADILSSDCLESPTSDTPEPGFQQITWGTAKTRYR